MGKKRAKKAKRESLAESLAETTIEEEDKLKILEVEKAESATALVIASAPIQEEEIVEETAFDAGTEIAKSFLETMKYLSSAVSTSDKKRFVIYLCVSAIGEETSIAFERSLDQSALSLSMFDNEDKAAYIAGVIGSVILSNEAKLLPEEILDIKKVWMSNNESYACAFSVRRIGALDTSAQVIRYMIDARKYLNIENKKEILNQITWFVPTLRAASDKRFYRFAASSAGKITKGIYRIVPDSLASTFLNWRDKAIWTLAVSASSLAAACLLSILYDTFFGRGIGLVSALAEMVFRIIGIVIKLVLGFDSYLLAGMRMMTIIVIYCAFTIVADRISRAPQATEDEDARMYKAVLERFSRPSKAAEIPAEVVVKAAEATVSVYNSAGESEERSLASLANNLKEKAETNWRSKTATRPGARREAWPDRRTAADRDAARAMRKDMWDSSLDADTEE
jgi:hypothetical protein